MNSRLQQFLDLEQLSPSKFADVIGVQRSGLSHILSGRNKPGYDFLYKLSLKFPQINVEWLLTGKGKPYKDMNYPIDNVEHKIEPRNLFSGTIPKPEEKLSYIPENKRDTPISATSELNENQKNIQSLPDSHQIRNVKRITIFYSDGSFEEFFPG